MQQKIKRRSPAGITFWTLTISGNARDRAPDIGCPPRDGITLDLCIRHSEDFDWDGAAMLLDEDQRMAYVSRVKSVINCMFPDAHDISLKAEIVNPEAQMIEFFHRYGKRLWFFDRTFRIAKATAFWNAYSRAKAVP
ncbi:MAG: hypothetical protein ABL951_16255 [Alphaproteobacteria bacterium]